MELLFCVGNQSKALQIRAQTYRPHSLGIKVYIFSVWEAKPLQRHRDVDKMRQIQSMGGWEERLEDLSTNQKTRFSQLDQSGGCAGEPAALVFYHVDTHACTIVHCTIAMCYEVYFDIMLIHVKTFWFSFSITSTGVSQDEMDNRTKSFSENFRH